jgi:C4-dicarboxylate-specific signal transduction histidine kinase
MFKQDTHGRERTDVNGVIHEALAILELDLRTQDVSVSTEIQDGVPQLMVNRAQLRQVFLNLILNAIDAMRSVERARELRITADVIQDGSNVIMTIEDSGSGLAKNDPNRIFEPFFTTKPTGMGIGLSVCRSIIESHRGTLQASARHPQGTIFEMVLPIGAGG